MTRWLRQRDRLRGDAGFTLVEVVMCVAIMGIITAALTGVVLSHLRNTVDTQARLTESHDVQFAAAYWQRDVASLGVRSPAYDATTHSFPLEQSVGLTPCNLPAGAADVVTLAWSEYTSMISADPPATVKVTYATRADGDVLELLRVRCGAAPSTVEVAHSLVAPPELVCVQPNGGSSCTAAGNGVPDVVRLRLKVHDASGHGTEVYRVELSGLRRQS